MFQTKVIQTIKTHILYSVTFFPPENHAVYEIMWKNMVERGRPQMTIWHMRIGCWIPKAANIHSQSVILIVFSTTAVVARTRLNFTFPLPLSVLFELSGVFLTAEERDGQLWSC
jgi:hypothetical protein